MKLILAPVDFSDASMNAVSFAAELTKRSGARLVIVNILQKGEDENVIKTKLKSVESDLKKSIDANLNCESLLAHGSLITTLKKMISVQQPDLIVMGTKGAGGLKKILIGSNTVKLLSNTRIPVLVIPEVARFENFFNKGKNRIILATDLDFVENEDALRVLKEISLFIIEPKLRVLSVRPKDTRLAVSKREERDFLMSFFKPEIDTERVTVFGKSVLGGINFYLDRKSTDTGLLAMIARDSGHLTQKHYTREMASYTHLPLLVLHDTKD
jgi:nucleotide-binding universal stress UspA family protein